jgi:hypothetical protein
MGRVAHRPLAAIGLLTLLLAALPRPLTGASAYRPEPDAPFTRRDGVGRPCARGRRQIRPLRAQPTRSASETMIPSGPRT